MWFAAISILFFHVSHIVFTLLDTGKGDNYPKGESVLKWKINENTDWKAFQTYLKKAFELSPLPVSNNVNTIWETWKNNIDIAANLCLGNEFFNIIRMGFILMSRVSPNIAKMFYKTFFNSVVISSLTLLQICS
jgi:hypothetical protein